MKKLIYLLFLFAPFSNASNEIIKEINVLAPMGLSWGMDSVDLAKKKIQLSNCSSYYGSVKCNGEFEEGSPLNYASSYYFIFDLDGGLQNFIIHSHVFENDPSGKVTKKLYSLLKNKISKQYGEPGWSMEFDSSLDHEFYKNINRELTTWHSYFISMRVGEPINFESSSIRIEIVGITDNSGKVIINYKSKYWEKTLKSINKNRILYHLGV